MIEHKILYRMIIGKHRTKINLWGTCIRSEELLDQKIIKIVRNEAAGKLFLTPATCL